MKKILISLAAIFLLYLFPSTAYASDFSITCDNSGCTPSVITGFFDTSESWYPLRSLTQKATITNTSGEPQFVGHSARNVYISPGANIAEVLDVEVVRQSDSSLMWSGTLQDLYDGNEIGLGTILTGDTETYTYTITMRDVGNEYQGKSTQFDMDFGYFEPTPTSEISPTSTPTPTATPTATPTPTPVDNENTSQSTSSTSGGDGGGGTGQILGVSAQSNPFSPILRSVRSFFGIQDENDSKPVDQPSPTPTETPDNVLGEQDNVCQNATWWWLVILVYGASGVVIYAFGKRMKRVARILVHGILTIIAIVLLVYALCNFIFAVILTAVIGIITQLLIESHAQE